jgi:hypothetical protein
VIWIHVVGVKIPGTRPTFRPVTTTLTKFEAQSGSDWLPHRYPAVFFREATTGAGRLKIAASKNGAQLMVRLAQILRGPFAVLYVLLVPRGGSEAGRYQSPWLDRDELTEVFDRYADFWEQDGRHHVWLHSATDRATLVYDRHDVIYAYGPLDECAALLEAEGFKEAGELNFPVPHGHCYHREFDPMERELASSPGWEHSPLQDGDEW